MVILITIIVILNFCTVSSLAPSTASVCCKQSTMIYVASFLCYVLPKPN